MKRVNSRIALLMLLILSCFLIVSCGDDVKYEDLGNCPQTANIFIDPNHGVQIQLGATKVRCDGQNLLSDIFLYTGTGLVSQQSVVQSNLEAMVGSNCEIRNKNGGNGWKRLDGSAGGFTDGNQYWYHILCIKQASGDGGTRVVDVKGWRSPGLLTNGPLCDSVGGESYTVKKTVTGSQYDCCRDEDDECIPNPDGSINWQCRGVPTESNSQIYATTSHYVNRGGYYDLNGGEIIRSSSICVPDTFTLDGNSITRGFENPSCDMDGLCMYGEDNSCSDCWSCEQRAKEYLEETGPTANKLNKISCQGDVNLPASFSRNPFCKWCPRPYQGQGTAGGGAHIGSAYPFKLPGYSTGASATAKSGCVHVTGGDPFNCGGCGLSAEIPTGSANEVLATNSFCSAALDSAEVYCVQKDETNYWSCKNNDEAIDVAKQPWFIKYARSNVANPSFFYTVEDVGDGGWSSTVIPIPAASGNLPSGGGVDGASSSGSGSGGRGGAGCFLSGTLISMKDGSFKKIEDVKLGDEVKSYDENSDSIAYGFVTHLFHHSPEEMPGYYLIINENLNVTPNHRIFTNKGVIDAGILEVGDLWRNEVGGWTKVNSIQRVDAVVPVFNLEIKPYHTYYANGLAVHNVKAPDADPTNSNRPRPNEPNPTEPSTTAPS